METGNRLVEDLSGVEAEEHTLDLNAGQTAAVPAAQFSAETEELEPSKVGPDSDEFEASKVGPDSEELEASELGTVEAESSEGTLEARLADIGRGHGLFDVLLPADPPQPKNARVIRLFDYEADQHEPRPAIAEVVAPEPRPEPKVRDREAVKAARNQSLLAAAGFLDKI